MVKRKAHGIASGVCLVAMTTVAALVGCSDAQQVVDGVCCKEFKVGGDQATLAATLEVDASVSGEFNAFAQAVSDLSVAAGGLVDDVTTSCRNIAVDLGTDPAKVRAAEALGSQERVTELCKLAEAALKASPAIKAAGTISIVATPPRCEASFDAKVACEAGCKVDANCNVDAELPKCTGGELTVKCEGTCTGSCEGSVEASAACEGKCEATCEGSCTAQANVAVDCDGQCTGTCTGTCDGKATTGGAGANCDGVCNGKCSATCNARAGANVKCNGKCDGRCTGSCKFDANAKVSCDAQCKGGCSGKATAPKCEGGKFETKCDVKGDCKANCDASVAARAECKPPQLFVKATGTLSTDVTRALASLEANLPRLLLAVEARGQVFQDTLLAVVNNGPKIAGSAGVSLRAKTCVAVGMVPVLEEARKTVPAALSGAKSITAQVNVKL